MEELVRAPVSEAAPAEAPPAEAPAAATEAPPAKEGELNAGDLKKEAEQARENATAEEAPPRTPGAGRDPGIVGLLVPLAIIFAIMYLLLIRPQKKKEQQRQEMLDRVQKDDKVVTIGGIIGVVSSMTDREIVLRLDDNTKLRLTRSAISRVIDKDQAE